MSIFICTRVLSPRIAFSNHRNLKNIVGFMKFQPASLLASSYTTSNCKNFSNTRYVETSTSGIGLELDSSISIPIKAKDIKLPLEYVSFAYARSSGPGGQNVNKLNTKAELRFSIDDAINGNYMPEAVGERLKEQEGNRINNSNELILTGKL